MNRQSSVASLLELLQSHARMYKNQVNLANINR